MNNLTELQKIAKIWQIQLNLEHTNPIKNVRLSFKDIGSFAELLAINYLNGYVGAGSGGMGFDLVNYQTKKAIEVKSCCTIQNAICEKVVEHKNNKDVKCGTKFNSLFIHKCPKCGCEKYKNISDSRFGIEAAEFLKQYKMGLFDRFYLCFVSLLEYNESSTQIIIHMEWFEINFNERKYRKIQLAYFKNQATKGKKSHCNLIPYSFDFYKLIPTKISDVVISFKINDLMDNPIVKERRCREELYIDLSKMHNQTERNLFKKLKTYNPKTQQAKATDFTLNIPYAKKTLGKNRGNTRTKIYNTLK